MSLYVHVNSPLQLFLIVLELQKMVLNKKKFFKKLFKKKSLVNLQTQIGCSFLRSLFFDQYIADVAQLARAADL